MNKAPIRIAVTGAAGQIGYSLLFRIASGAALGPDQPVILHLLERADEKVMAALQGVCMELDDCAFPLLKGIVATSNPDEAFKGVNWALLVAARNRAAREWNVKKIYWFRQRQDLHRPGQCHRQECRERCPRARRRQSLQHQLAHRCEQRAPGVPANTFLRHDRARRKPRARRRSHKRPAWTNTAVTNLAIWGNHSATMYPDFFNAKVNGRPVPDVISHREWLEKGFHLHRATAWCRHHQGARPVQRRQRRTNAACNTVYKLTHPTPAGDWFSVAVCSDGSYGIEKNLMFSYPIRSNGKDYEIVQGVPLNAISARPRSPRRNMN